MKSIAELKEIREKMQSTMNIRKDSDDNIRVVVGMATCGIAAGARPVLAALVDDVGVRGLGNVKISQTGCIGVCRLEPIVEVYEPGKEKVTYVNMTPDKAKRVVAEHLVNHSVVDDYTIGAAE
ncbi:MAG: (2Fe-2S) ferredoxin domain-containing protein [Oscillospiraceae bacterium]|jgi:NADP-reducing hydrogenase subunit HndB|nr:(2Fe-2S) ferredoxin domain-containing protein [Oscillospiraceae bacterium]